MFDLVQMNTAMLILQKNYICTKYRKTYEN